MAERSITVPTYRSLLLFFGIVLGVLYAQLRFPGRFAFSFGPSSCPRRSVIGIYVSQSKARKHGMTYFLFFYFGGA